jgi:lipopolysaccharide transport system ATP-binding protein
MENCYIKIRNADLFYPSSPYNAFSIKELVCNAFKGKNDVKLIKDVHAVNNVCLDIHEGDRLGIIGRNGAGKSTILKAIGGIYPLTNGTIEVKGIIRALFELNLGFDFDATGRENIMYRGLLLGELPSVVKAKTQEIIDFAELGEFIDYPVKAYSAGMQVRLAFAISTSIRGEIVLLDEVIGAGDAAFFKKAKARITDLIQSAKILVLVSHDLGSIKEFCNRVIWMDKGSIIADGKPEEVINSYLKQV